MPTIYIYDGRPLANVRIGQTVTLIAKRRRLTMTSVATGTTSSTEDFADSAGLWYRNKPVGFITCRRRLSFSTLGSANVSAVKVGDYLPGIPEMEVVEFDERERVGVPQIESPRLRVYVREDKWGGPQGINYEFANPSLAIIQPRKGSSAKPHVGAFDGGSLLFEVTAQQTAYQDALALAGRPLAAMWAEYDTRVNAEGVKQGFYYLYALGKDPCINDGERPAGKHFA